MEQVKYKVFEVLSRTLSVEAFEQWLYADPYVAEHITDDELVLELMNLDFKSRFALHELEKLCFKYFDKEECLCAVVEYNCLKIVNEVSEIATHSAVKNICQYYVWEENYKLIQWFRSLSYDMEGNMEWPLVCAEDYALIVIAEMKAASVEERKMMLKEGIPGVDIYDYYEEEHPPQGKSFGIGLFIKEFFQTCFRFFMQQPPMDK